MNIKIEYYRTNAGKSPFLDWLDSLDSSVQATIQVRLARVRSGNLGKIRVLGGSISELKFKKGPGYRVYYTQLDETLVILLCGGNKSDQKNDIKKAKAYLLDYKSRKKI